MKRHHNILNVIDVESKLVVAQLSVKEKTNEMTAIPELLSLLEIKDSIITIDVIGTTNRIMDKICSRGGHFVLSVRKNNSERYRDIMSLFKDLEKEQGLRLQAFMNQPCKCCRLYGK